MHFEAHPSIHHGSQPWWRQERKIRQIPRPCKLGLEQALRSEIRMKRTTIASTCAVNVPFVAAMMFSGYVQARLTSTIALTYFSRGCMQHCLIRCTLSTLDESRLASAPAGLEIPLVPASAPTDFSKRHLQKILVTQSATPYSLQPRTCSSSGSFVDTTCGSSVYIRPRAANVLQAFKAASKPGLPFCSFLRPTS